MSTVKRGVACTVGLCLLAACASDGASGVPISASEPTGSLVQRWSIEGASDPAKCARYGAARMRVVVYDEEGTVHATQFSDCAAFEARIELLARPYHGSATFVGADGQVVSDTHAIESFIVAAGAETLRTVDFSAAEMRAPSP